MAKSIIYENLPELGSPYGFFFYSALCYIFTLFVSWLMKGDEKQTAEDIKRRLEMEQVKERGTRMREINKQEGARVNSGPPKTSKELGNKQL
ncbi:hypothetical protein FGO68_gene5168 [Halteria grandinella]|uniref:Uncharacterized protein n=1 Tax=Halteria grandinella TaxID=5974 RepID=A0A8J8T8X6_HALGN|nr:hypothetical protein FGO68_gene5168 [Halteria grandinella]